MAKCDIGKPNVLFLGHIITAKGISLNNDKVDAILNFKKPQKAFELRLFLLFMNFYRRFLPHAAATQGKLQALIEGNKKKDQTLIEWSEEANNAFERCKSDLATVTCLSHPVAGAQLVLHVDASDFAVGAVLQQIVNDELQPLGFYSKRITDTQRRYSTYDRELLAIYQSIKFFKYMICNCIIYTDHKPLILAFQQKPDKASPRQLRHLDFIGQFSTDLRHVSGKDGLNRSRKI